jgi:hypothetical protein
MGDVNEVRVPQPSYNLEATMPDQLTVKDEGKSFTPCPEGSQHAVCVDVIDLGETMESFQGNAAEKKHKVALVFQTDEENADTGKRYEPSVEFTVSFGPKANLRKFVGNWRGKPYSDEEARESGAPLHKLVGVNAILNIQHKTSGAGRLYAIIASVAPPMKNMAKIVPHHYERSEHWAKRKEEYAGKVREHERLTSPVGEVPNFDDPPPQFDGPDDLPF